MSENNFDGVVVSKSKYGVGVFSAKKFFKLDVIFEFKGEKVSKDKIKPEIQEYYTQIDKNLYLSPSGEPDDYTNHSCNPNCGVRFRRGKMLLIAIKDIEPNKELTFDYSTNMYKEEWTMRCSCNSDNCRGIISNYEDLPENTKTKYKALKIIPKFVLD